MRAMLTIIWRIWKDRGRGFGVYSFSVCALTLMFASILPSMIEQGEELAEFYESFPQEFFVAFGIEEFSFDTLEKFLSIEFYSIMWPILVVVFAAGLAGYLLAGEIERGTIEHILARPQSRVRVFLSKYLGGATMLIAFTAISTFFALPAAWMFDVPFEVESGVYIFILSSLFALAIYSLGMLFSAISSEKGRVSMLMGGMFLGMYAANVVSLLIEDFENLRYFSFFFYFDYEAALVDHVIAFDRWAIFALVIVGATLAGGYLFNKRDIAV